MHRRARQIIRYILVLFLGVYLSYVFTNIISPKVQLFVDISSKNIDDSIQIFTYNEEYLNVFPDENGRYSANIDIYSKSYNMDFLIRNDGVLECNINGDKFDKITKISEYTTSYLYQNCYCIKLNVKSSFHFIIFIGITFFWVLIFWYINAHELFSNKQYRYLFTYSKTAFIYIGWKPLILSFAVTLISLAFYYGCDLNVISETIILYQKGIDFYQMFASLNQYKGAELLMWQYNGSMLAGYNLISLLFYPFLCFFDPGKYHLIQAFEYKLFNLAICNLLILSVISFLIDNEFIQSSRAKELYYWSIFNPLTFYVAIIFIQFDILPAYLIGLGILLLQDIHKNKIISATLIGLGISCKMTLYLFIPSIIFLIFFVFFKEHDKTKQKICFLTILSFIFMLVLLIPQLLDTPISIAYKNLAQSERIWFTTIQYAPTVFLFICIFGLIVLFVFNIYNINLKIPLNNVILNTLYFIGAIALIFSFATLSTPSFFIQTIPAFILLYMGSDDNFQRFWIASVGLLVASNMMFIPEGDITSSLMFFEKKPLFTLLKEIMIEQGEKVKWISLIHTITCSVAFAYAIIFVKKGQDILKSIKH